MTIELSLFWANLDMEKVGNFLLINAWEFWQSLAEYRLQSVFSEYRDCFYINILFLKIPIKDKTTCRGAFGSVFILVNFCLYLFIYLFIQLPQIKWIKIYFMTEMDMDSWTPV